MIFFIVLVLLFILFIFVISVYPVETESLKDYSKRKFSYQESIDHIQQDIANDPENVADYGHSILMTHGSKSKQAVVFYHGYTNCPRQYEELAKIFFDKGYNVYVPRVPYSGIKDLYTKEIGKLTISDIKQVCNTSIDLAHGLGNKVTVIGLSMGGVMSAYNAQFRDDVEMAVVIVPSFGWYFLPRIIKPLINLSFIFPNQYLWWDPVKKDDRQCPYSMYHHFSTHGMAHILRLGLSVLRSAKKTGPITKKIVVMTNDLDIAVDAKSTEDLVKRWKSSDVSVEWYRFSKEHNMEHDIIDPLHPYAKTDLVYSKIMEYADLI